MKKIAVVVLLAFSLVGTATAAGAAVGNPKNYDADGNGMPDVGAVVSGNQSAVYEYGTVTCAFRMNYRGTFENDPYLDSGWIQNHYQCDDGSSFNYLIVHQSDPRYTGNPDTAMWGTWEIVGETWSGSGNVAKPRNPNYAY